MVKCLVSLAVYLPDPESEDKRHNINTLPVSNVLKPFFQAGTTVTMMFTKITKYSTALNQIHLKYLTTTVIKNFEIALDWLTDTYVDAMNIIHFMTDKYNYEAVQMAFLANSPSCQHGLRYLWFANTVDSLSNQICTS